jgi:hypothetical protein
MSIGDQDISTGFPFMILQNGPFLDLLGLDPSLPALFESMERARQTVTHRPNGAPIVVINMQRASE